MVKPITLKQQQAETLFIPDKSYLIKIVQDKYGMVWKLKASKKDLMQSMPNLISVHNDVNEFDEAFNAYGVKDSGPN